MAAVSGKGAGIVAVVVEARPAFVAKLEYSLDISEQPGWLWLVYAKLALVAGGGVAFIVGECGPRFWQLPNTGRHGFRAGVPRE